MDAEETCIANSNNAEPLSGGGKYIKHFLTVTVQKPPLADAFRSCIKHVHHHEKVSGRGWPCRNALKSTSDRPGCEKGASWEAPLMVANDSAPPPYT
jgi:hypothetical protein